MDSSTLGFSIEKLNIQFVLGFADSWKDDAREHLSATKREDVCTLPDHVHFNLAIPEALCSEAQFSYLVDSFGEA